MDEIKQELKQIHARLDSMDAKFEAKFEAIDAKFDEKFGMMHRHFDMAVERMESIVQLLAESISACNKKNGQISQRVEQLEENQQLTNMRLALLEKR